jgi:hypothetical protein
MMRLLQERGFEWLDIGPCAGATPDEPGDRLHTPKKAFAPEVVLYPGYSDRPLRPLACRAWRLAETHGLPMAKRALAAGRRFFARDRSSAVRSAEDPAT